MGIEQIEKQITYLTILKFAEEIRKIVINKNNSDSYVKEIISLLLSFIKSNDFIPFIIVNKENFFFNFYIMCDIGKNNDKFLFIKILFPLLEELKKSQFERKLWEINHIKKDEQKKYLISYYNENKNIINEKIIIYTNKSKKPFEVLKNMIKSKGEMLGKYLSRIINVLFENEVITKKIAKSQNIIDESFNFFNTYFYDFKKTNDFDASKLVEYLIDLYPSLENIKLIYNLTMFTILKSINEDEMKLYLGNNEKKIDILSNIMELNNDNFTWFLSHDFKKEQMKVSGKMVIKNEQVGINFFKIIDVSKKDKIKIIYGYICKSILIKYDIIMIEINLFYYKVNNINLETLKNELEEEIKRIKESNNEYKDLNVYIHIEDTAILYPQSYDLFLHNLVDKDIISFNQVPEEYQNTVEVSLKRNKTEIIPKHNENMKEDINNNDKTWIGIFRNKITNNEGENKEKKDPNKILFSCKTFNDGNINDNNLVGNNQRIQDIQNNENDSLQVNQLKEELEKEKLKNKDLSQIIKNLENKIIEENNKNKNLELKIKELTIELDLLKEKYNKIKNLQGNGGQIPMDNIEIRESLYETVYEKEKEIKELRLQLSRYPLVLNDGEKLMSLIFTSADQVIHHSVICKNNENFSNVESRLYDDGFPEYKESENYFTFNGIKINKSKTLEENNIKNSDVIILNVIDDDD